MRTWREPLSQSDRSRKQQELLGKFRADILNLLEPNLRALVRPYFLWRSAVADDAEWMSGKSRNRLAPVLTEASSWTSDRCALNAPRGAALAGDLADVASVMFDRQGTSDA